MSYPKLIIQFSSKYINLKNNEESEFNVFIQREPNGQLIEIPYNNINLQYSCLDNNILFITKNNKNYFYGINIGSATLSFYYSETINNILYEYNTKEEVIVYDSFFKDNYLFLLTDLDKKIFEKNILLKSIMNTCMEYFDILWVYQNDIKTLKDPLKTRWKFLENLGLSLGFGKISRDYDNKYKEKISDRLYRELLSNLFDLLQIRGTKLSYDMFFGALGYDIELLEFWNDGDGNLIEINPYNEDNSTFYKYSLDGYLIGDELNVSDDPRKNWNKNNPTYIYNKSHFVKPILTRKVGLENYVEEAGYTMQHRFLINKFLNFLKPEHIEYLEEAFRIFIPEQPDPYGINKDAETIQLLIDNNELYIVILRYVYQDPLISLYLNPDTQLEEQKTPNYDIDEEDLNTHQLTVSDPGRIDWDGIVEKGTYKYAGGMYIEHIFKDTNDFININKLIEIFDECLYGMPRYDQGYHYDASGEQTPIFYDRAILFNEDFNVVQI